MAVPYTFLVAALVVLACRLDFRYDRGTGTLWGLAIWGAGHMAGGVIPLGGPLGGKRTLYNAGGDVNRGWDLVFDLLGGIVAGVWLATRTAPA